MIIDRSIDIMRGDRNYDADQNCLPEGMVAFHLPDIGRLANVLSRSSARDAYCKSHLYYYLTGRGTIFGVRHNDESWVIITRHPNTADAWLVFFPFANTSVDFSEQLLTLLKYRRYFRGGSVFLARIDDGLAKAILSLTDIDPIVTLREVDEETLDWAYPSYDISIPKLASRNGSNLKLFCKKVRQFSETSVTIVPYKDMRLDLQRKVILDITENWVTNSMARKSGLSGVFATCTELVEPYQWLSENHANLRVDGIFLRRGTEFIGFGFWEKVRSRDDVVPSIAALPRSYERGLSEYLYLQIARTLHNDGYKRMCIGGSETEGLDRFKRKLAPVAGHHLRTIHLRLNDI